MSLKMYVFFGILLFLGLACKDVSDQTPVNFTYEIDALTDETSKKEYLELIFKKDQAVRQGDGEIIVEHGIDSKEYRTHIKNMNIQDVENLAKIEHYLKVFDYPQKELGEIANMTPWLVIHHANTYKARARNFPILYKAYIQNNLDEGQFSMLLSRMYSIEKGSHPEMIGSYKEKDKINMIIEALELQTTE